MISNTIHSQDQITLKYVIFSNDILLFFRIIVDRSPGKFLRYRNKSKIYDLFLICNKSE